jgi:mono/diheme cytochrome c family protein
VRRLLLLLPLVAVLAACGGEKTVEPLPKTVVGTVPTMPASTSQSTATSPSNSGGQSNGQALFAANGCNGCHTFKPAGSTAKIGPDLDKLAQYARQAKQPLAAFARESIVKPSAYVQPGYPDAMPKSYGSLPKAQVDALVKYVTTGK